MKNKPKYWVTWLVAAICTLPAFLFTLAVLLSGMAFAGMAAFIGIIAVVWLIIVGITFAFEYDEYN